MQEIDDIQYLTTLDQVHTLADPLRVRIVDRLVREPMTVKMLGTDLGEQPAKIHYHVRELERIGVIHLVETREKGGILEKYYRAVARNISVQEDLLRTTPPDELSAITQDYMQLVQRGLLAALAHHQQHPEEDLPAYINGTAVWATPEEARALMNELSKLIEPYQNPHGVPREREWTMNLIAHAAITEPEVEEAKKIRRDTFVGLFHYSKKELEAVVAEGVQLDLTVLGTGAFADDVTPELADRAIARMRVYGVVHARPEVQAILKQKQNTREVRPVSPPAGIKSVPAVREQVDTGDH